MSLLVCMQSEGGTPLYIASQEGHLEVARLLLGAGADVNQATVRDHSRLGPCTWVG